MADDAGDCVDVGRELRGGLDRPEASVEDVVPIVRAHGLRLVLPEFDLTAELPQGARRDLPAERMDLDGNRRRRAEAGDELRVVDDHDKLLRCGRDDLLAEQRASETLDQVELGVDLVRAVY